MFFTGYGDMKFGPVRFRFFGIWSIKLVILKPWNFGPLGVESYFWEWSYSPCFCFTASFGKCGQWIKSMMVSVEWNDLINQVVIFNVFNLIRDAFYFHWFKFFLEQGWLFASDDLFWKPPQMKVIVSVTNRASVLYAWFAREFPYLLYFFWHPLIVESVPLLQALLHSVPVGKMVVLDLFADVKPIWSRSDHFYGIPYIW